MPYRVEEADLSEKQRQAFLNQGFVHVPGVVPANLVENARRVINHQLGQPNSMVFDEQAGNWKLGGGLQSSPEILALLYQSPAYTYAQRLIGRDRVNKPRYDTDKKNQSQGQCDKLLIHHMDGHSQGQIALRFPQTTPAPDAVKGTQWHIVRSVDII